MASLPEILDRIKKTLEGRQAFIENDKCLTGIKLNVRLDKKTGRVKTVQGTPDFEQEFGEK